MIRFVIGLMVGLLLGQLSNMDTSPLILVILAYIIGILHSNVVRKLEDKNAKK
jgi:F0F1-type ATP synthase assembly protein I